MGEDAGAPPADAAALDAFRRAVLTEIAERVAEAHHPALDPADRAVGGVLLDAEPEALGSDHDVIALRYSALTAHRHFVWVVSPNGLAAAGCALEALRWHAGRLREAGPSPAMLSPDAARLRQELLAPLAGDLDTPGALAALWSLIRSSLPLTERRALVDEIDQLLGLELCPAGDAASETLPDAALALIDERGAARLARDWARSDELRDRLAALGVEAQDTREGSIYRRAAAQG